MLSPRRLAATAAGLAVLVFAALALLTLMGTIEPGTAATAVALLITIGALAFLVFVVRRLDGRTHRIDLRVKKNDAQLAGTAAALKRIEARLDQLARSIEDTAVRRNEDLGAILASLGEDRVNAMARAREVEELRAEVRGMKDRV
ncbi:hypothetical protein ACIBG8_20535 [Nonomuraea sp. NPDC050556]|uniref:hypothetical protein n=1 Tax=Nonomuraea sp. NPDC050556 TaxID=3364369 RepID=UPI00379ACC85